MIDIRLIKENPDEIIARYEAKEAFVADEIHEILRLDGERRAMIAENEKILNGEYGAGEDDATAAVIRLIPLSLAPS